ncbi:glycine zipper 2TM domain-containing protein [Arcobacter sp.]|uniref:glycine zipper 2TM domain-containing protein n=1 Tax=unclassified Arcobacter TaxID=2593671 RepID=UPI003B00E596
MKKQSACLILGLTILSSSLFAQGDRFTQRVKVNYSKPVYENIQEVIPNHASRCYEEYEVRTPVHNRTYSSNRNENIIGVDTIIGATTGVIIGNQIGRGNGKVAAKIVGGLLGATLANGIRNSDYSHNNRNNTEYYYETKRRNICNNRVINKSVLKGYENYFTYNGKSYSKFSPYRENYINIETNINF